MNFDIGTISITSLLLGGFLFFVRREFRQWEDTHKTIGEIKGSVTMASEIREVVAKMHDDFVRFFSERGERATMWKTIDELKARVDSLEKKRRR